jgi:prephenate dehydrogenase
MTVVCRQEISSPAEAMPQRWAPGAQIGIIGGSGEMGRLFTRFFQERGYRVVVSDRDTGDKNREVAESSQIILFAVPLHRTVPIIRELIPYTREDQLLMDVSSLKTAPVQEMLRSPSCVVGLHPMFGGRVASLEGQTLVACPVRIPVSDWNGLRGLFTEAGIRVKESTPEQHDRMMSIVQVLFHMTTMLTGRILRELDIEIAETMDYTSPSYRLEISFLGRMFAQSGALYSAITQMNPHTPEIIASFKEGLELYEKWIGEGDLGAFVRDFEMSAAHLGDFCGQAYKESSAVLEYMIRRNGDSWSD